MGCHGDDGAVNSYGFDGLGVLQEAAVAAGELAQDASRLRAVGIGQRANVAPDGLHELELHLAQDGVQEVGRQVVHAQLQRAKALCDLYVGGAPTAR